MKLKDLTDKHVLKINNIREAKALVRALCDTSYYYWEQNNKQVTVGDAALITAYYTIHRYRLASVSTTYIEQGKYTNILSYKDVDEVREIYNQLNISKKNVKYLYENNDCKTWRSILKRYTNKFSILDDEDATVEVEEDHLNLIHECTNTQKNLLKECGLYYIKDDIDIEEKLEYNEMEELLKPINDRLFNGRKRIKLLISAEGRKDGSDKRKALFLAGQWETIKKDNSTIIIPLKT